MYGLNDAARAWFVSVKDLLIKCGCVQSVLDNALFGWRCEGNLEGIIIIHVDGFLVTGTDNFSYQW